MEDLTKAITSLTTQVKENGTKIEGFSKDFSGKLDKHVEDITKLIDDKFEDCKNEILNLKKRVDELEVKFDNKEDSAHRVNCLNISGIPYKAGENLSEIFKTLSAKVGFVEPPDVVAYRYPGKDAATRQLHVIFPTEFHKLQFLKAYYVVAKTFTLDCINGFTGDKTRIYLQHDFTPKQYQVHKAAMAFLKGKKVYKVRVNQGNHIAVLIREGGRFKVFEDVASLEKEVNAAITTNEGSRQRS